METHLLKVAAVTTLAEAELIKNLLEDAGIPSLIQAQNALEASLQTGGPRDVMVIASRYEEAKAIIYGSPLDSSAE